MNDYLQTYHPNLRITPHLYHQSEFGIHFSLGNDLSPLNDVDGINNDYFQLVYQQAMTIFDELFHPDDELIWVTNMYKSKYEKKNVRPLKVYQPYLKDKRALYRLHVHTYPYPFENDEEGDEMQQFSLNCKRNDIRILPLLKSAIHEDFPLKPRFGGYAIGYPDVLFVNTTKNVTFFLYDDRGCEVTSLNADTIRPLYETYRSWIAEYDRQDIEERLRIK
ncbi:DUF3885 domain-containing protein [Priestia koreensis]|uniref:DUF3885 domain-containing protein n=1 Tax=Priestia koreensis TaxID=284581 RepID=UPI00203C905A|nr:DUF3885 domain-containing protein [Priestia koreensis]MCM3004933.1 DUF3885 domain-containing protein [Priestia koreensis]